MIFACELPFGNPLIVHRPTLYKGSVDGDRLWLLLFLVMKNLTRLFHHHAKNFRLEMLMHYACVRKLGQM